MGEKVVYYCGQPITELSRDELIDALKTTSQLLEDQFHAHERTLRVWEMFRKARS